MIMTMTITMTMDMIVTMIMIMIIIIIIIMMTTHNITASIPTQVHSILDKVGYIPGVGSVANAINAGLYAGRGKWKNAAWSAVGAIPGGGQVAKGLKFSRKVFRHVLRGSSVIRKAAWKSSKKGMVRVNIREKPGKTFRDAWKDFSRLVDRRTITKFGKGGKTGYMGKTRNGYEVKVRSFSSDGRPTLEINRWTKDGKMKKMEIRYGNADQGNKRRRG